MKILGRCQVCKKRSLIVKKRTFKHKNISKPVTSLDEICGGCFRNVKKMVA